jgi:VCBS repeat-containing protein
VYTFPLLVATNSPPEVNAGPDATVEEGARFTAGVSFQDPDADDHWTATVDYGDGTGVQPLAFTPDKQADLDHVYVDNGQYLVTVTVTDADGEVARDSITVTVDNVAPTASLDGDTMGVRGQTLTLTLGANDPSRADEAAEFTYFVDWNGDGSIDEEISAPDGHQAEHTYDANGNYTIRVRARDKDLATGPEVSHALEIVSAMVDENDLIVGGTSGDDFININQGSVIVDFRDEFGALQERYAFEEIVDRIFVYGYQGNDTIVVQNLLDPVSHLYGGPGADDLQGGGGDNELYGGEGDDLLKGGPCDNWLDGGPGDDTFTDKGGANTIIGGLGSNTFIKGTGSNDFRISPNATGPESFTDAYEMPEGGRLEVSAAGVLANDLNTSDHMLEAELASGPTHGSLTLERDGSFVYVPDRGFQGDDVFRYFPIGSTVGSETTVTITVVNADPTLEDVTFELSENSPAGTVVGRVTGSDPGDDPLRYRIAGEAPFDVDPLTGLLTVGSEAVLDFESTPSWTFEVEVADDENATDTGTVTVNLLNQANISGVVFVDVNRNGSYEENEPGIDGVTIELLDAAGEPILDGGMPVYATTGDGGLYRFEDLDPGDYRLHEVQPSGVDDGEESLGSAGGTVLPDDTMQLSLARVDATDYLFAELGRDVTSGDTGTIGFWQNKHGQQLIAEGGVNLAAWLTSNFGNVFGNTFSDGVGDDGQEVAAFFKDQLFRQKGRKSAGPAKVDAQFMAAALATYFTSSDLAGNVAADYGFHVTKTGIGTKIVNVGARGAAFGEFDDTDLTVMQLLLATSRLTDDPDHIAGFAEIYDTNGDGFIDALEAVLREMANQFYSTINEQGDR